MLYSARACPLARRLANDGASGEREHLTTDRRCNNAHEADL